MNSKLKTTLIALLALTTIGAGALAWQQNRALVALRNKQSRSASDDRAALEKRLTAAEHRAHDLQNELDALKARASNDDAPPDDPQNAAAIGDRRSRFRGRGPEAFLAMMNDPKIAQLVNSRDKLMLDSRYATLFKNLTQGTNGTNLSPEQLEAFKNLLVEKANTTRDVVMTARAEGVSDRAEIRDLVKNAQAELDAQIQTTLGPDGFTQYQEYEKTLPQRNVVNQFAQSLSYTSAPLSDTQTAQLIKLLADTSPTTQTGTSRANRMNFGPGGPTVTITDEVIAQAPSFLTPIQTEALASYKKQQDDQTKLWQSINAANSARPSTSGNAAAPAVVPPPPPP